MEWTKERHEAARDAADKPFTVPGLGLSVSVGSWGGVYVRLVPELRMAVLCLGWVSLMLFASEPDHLIVEGSFARARMRGALDRIEELERRIGVMAEAVNANDCPPVGEPCPDIDGQDCKACWREWALR